MRFSFIFIGLIITLSFLKNATQAQTKKYVIYFTDKNNSPYSVNKPEEFLSQRAILRRQKQNILITNRDLPVNKVYADSLNSLGANVWYTSKWFNAAVIEADSATQSVINNLGFVKNSENLTKKRISSSVEKKLAFEKNSFPKRITGTNKININYGPSFNQAAMIGADIMHADGYRGEGMIIGILDAGFENANTLPVFDSLFTNNQILGTYDFVTNDTSVYEDYWHGTSVLSTIGGYLEGQIIGTAYKASFFLFRTEDVFSEFHIEEINWLIAAEYADSAGVDVINTSLGYTDFDDPAMNYTYSDMDGNTALITRAADFAAATGMLIVNSAGNLGNSSWKYIAAPADGDSVLTVGAVDLNEVYASFSSQGPSYDGRVKPNLMAQGQNIWAATSSGGFTYSSGTSFSSPILCGMAAGFWQANPGLTNMEVIDYLQRSASHYVNPNDQYGYGIPDYSKAQQLVFSSKGGNIIVNNNTVYPNPFTDQDLVLFIDPQDQGNEIIIKIFDLSGRIIALETIAKAKNINKLNINSKVLLPGIYLISVITPNALYTTKVVKI
ncbi:MAG: S8 family serine peptidase [Bacteroidetes bacterium]|nr:S8 family serine peptidase [Bacteroidota bacterium]